MLLFITAVEQAQLSELKFAIMAIGSFLLLVLLVGTLVHYSLKVQELESESGKKDARIKSLTEDNDEVTSKLAWYKEGRVTFNRAFALVVAALFKEHAARLNHPWYVSVSHQSELPAVAVTNTKTGAVIARIVFREYMTHEKYPYGGYDPGKGTNAETVRSTNKSGGTTSASFRRSIEWEHIDMPDLLTHKAFGEQIILVLRELDKTASERPGAA